MKGIIKELLGWLVFIFIVIGHPGLSLHLSGSGRR